MITATVCTFKREIDSKIERGIAIVAEPGLYDVITIIPEDATSIADVVQKSIHWYDLHWSEGTMTLPKHET